MSRYEAAYGTDWDALSEDEATERAYAIGVAEKLGEYNREELETIYEAMDSTYTKSMVELAYREGRQEATEAARDADDGDALWASLVENEEAPVARGSSTGGRDGLPEALEPEDVLDLERIDSTDVLDLPDFLDK